MSDQDPFAAFESERTVIKPSAGRGRAGAPAGGGAGGGGGPGGPGGGGFGGGGGGGFGGGPGGPGGAMGGPAGGGKEAPLAIDALMSASLNPLVSAAMPLLTTAPRIRHMVQHPNPAGLKDALSEGIRKFESQARADGLPNEQIIAARYVLCTLLDESAASTPWGGSGVWSAQSLLVQFHNETWGGEKVFQLMSKLAENIPANRNLLELLYVCLAFGFEGRYRVLDNGRAQLDAVRQRLSQLLRQGRPEPDKALSPRWKGEEAQASRLRDGIPLWVIGAFAGLLLLGIYIAFRFSINSHSDPVFSALQAMDAKVGALAAPTPPPAEQPRLAGFLKPEIDAGLVNVQDLADRSIITIKGDGFFEPGSADIADKVLPLLVRIEAALQSVPGSVLITGHTDNQPIRSLRYPSNWHLSQDRANAVRTVLSANLPADRLRAEGRADAEAVAENTTPEGRAKNRRVEITLFVQQAQTNNGGK
ncbi:MAG TPA: DotU family type VI secretion system protein [Aquabacterium sp.]|uniref:DotU family type VI secretion system protein n=1 Tax=Aquabacterium sp. TaxID=1872578 RepID=UPI002E340DBA|nr:DotU family type VI secretion system protein [Aquabacterium sp.]HEX5373945.1 DotU family type VI secretion system protein [Aquabacterium sp.]